MKLFDAGPSHLASSIGLLLLRLAAGGMMIGHGWGKLTGFGEMKGGFPDPLGVGSAVSLVLTIGAEFGCALLVVLGLATRVAAVPVAFAMGVAAFVIHGDDPFAKKELALLYLAAYLALLFTGAGRFSIDARLANRRRD